MSMKALVFDLDADSTRCRANANALSAAGAEAYFSAADGKGPGDLPTVFDVILLHDTNDSSFQASGLSAPRVIRYTGGNPEHLISKYRGDAIDGRITQNAALKQV